MTAKRGVGGVALFVGAVAVAVGPGCASGPSATGGAPGAETLGSVNMALKVYDGVTLTALDWSITDSGNNTVMASTDPGQQPWRGAGASAVRFVIGGIPQGNGYAIRLDGSDSAGDRCNGSAVFNIVAGQSTNATVNVVCSVANDGGTAAAVTKGGIIVTGSVTVDVAPPTPCPGITSFSISPADIIDGQSATLAIETIGPSPVDIVWAATADGRAVGAFGPSAEGQTTFQCKGFVGLAEVTATLDGPSACAALPFTTASASIVCEAAPAPDPNSNTGGDAGADATSTDASAEDAGPPVACVDGTMPSPAGSPIFIDLSSGTPVVSSPNGDYWTSSPFDGLHSSVTQTGDGVWEVDIGLVGAYRGVLTSNRGVELRSPASGDVLLSYGVDSFAWNNAFSWTTIYSRLFVLDSSGHLAGRTPRISNAVVPQMCLVPDTFQLALPGITTEWDTFDIYIRAPG